MAIIFTAFDVFKKYGALYRKQHSPVPVPRPEGSAFTLVEFIKTPFMYVLKLIFFGVPVIGDAVMT